jgi:FtsP/CotA-like multicopper oxidase with cupredoxin domain
MISYLDVNVRSNPVTCLMSYRILGGILLATQAIAAQSQIAAPPLLSNPPEARSPVVLMAVNDPRNGKGAFSFEGHENPPVIRAFPGEDIRLRYINAMSADSHERCIGQPCMNMTNLHFHGLHVPPTAPQDDVLTMMAIPGQSLDYVVNIPSDQPPGLYWYHPHPHGETYQQDLDGMSEACRIHP